MLRRAGVCASVLVRKKLRGALSHLAAETHSGRDVASPGPSRPGGNFPSINSVSLVGVAHDLQSGFVFEEAVLQFTLTTTSLQTSTALPQAGRPAASAAGDCVVEKDHHVIRCFGELFSQEVQQKVKEGSVVCVNGRLRLNPQLEPSVNKYYYFPYVQVQPPHGQVAVVFSDRNNPPQPVETPTGNADTATAPATAAASSGEPASAAKP